MRICDPKCRALLLASSLAFAGECTVIHPTEPMPAPGEPSSGTSAPSRPQRLAALVSIYYHANEAALGVEREADAFTPLAADDAARILRADESPRGHSRQRRAVAKLAAANIHQAEFRDALKILLNRPEAGEPFGEPEFMIHTIELVLGVHPEMGIPEREALISNLLELVYGPAVAGCVTRDLTTSVHCERGPTAAVTSGSATVEVLRPVAEIARGFDGQSWDECCDLFGPTYVAKQVAGEYPIDKDHNALPDPKPPRPGTSWRGVLFETADVPSKHFELSQFKTLLDIGAELDPAGSWYVFDYGLRYSIWSRVFGIPSADGIRVDYGYLSAAASSPPGWTHVKNTKTVQFANPALNLAACALLGALSDAVVELACCTPPAPTPLRSPMP